MSGADVGGTSYQCVVGHVIADEELEEATEITSLDGGAVIRQCKEHGAPVALTITPGPGHGQPQDGDRGLC